MGFITKCLFSDEITYQAFLYSGLIASKVNSDCFLYCLTSIVLILENLISKQA